MQLTLRNLIDNETGETNLSVLKAMARRRAIAETGFASPRAVREALAHYRDFILPMQCGWRQAHGLPVETTMVSAFGNQGEGVRRSAF